jgi:hypothetical protein
MYQISILNYKNGNTSKSQLVPVRHEKLAVFSKNANNGIFPYVYVVFNLIPFYICVICERVGVLKNQIAAFSIHYRYWLIKPLHHSVFNQTENNAVSLYIPKTS